MPSLVSCLIWSYYLVSVFFQGDTPRPGPSYVRWLVYSIAQCHMRCYAVGMVPSSDCCHAMCGSKLHVQCQIMYDAMPKQHCLYVIECHHVRRCWSREWETSIHILDGGSGQTQARMHARTHTDTLARTRTNTHTSAHTIYVFRRLRQFSPFGTVAGILMCTVWMRIFP